MHFPSASVGTLAPNVYYKSPVMQNAAANMPQPTQTINVANTNDQNPDHTFTKPPENQFVYQTPAIYLNPSSVPMNRPETVSNHEYYRQLASPKYTARPIYVRVLKPFQQNVLVDRRALNNQIQMPQRNINAHHIPMMLMTNYFQQQHETAEHHIGL